MNLRSGVYYTDIVQAYLSSMFPSDSKVTEKCIIAVEAYVDINCRRHSRIIALIRKRTSHAVVIFRVRKKPFNDNYQPIDVLDVFPLNTEFLFDSDNTRILNDDLQPAILTGEDCTLLDFDPLLSVENSSANLDSNDFTRKKYNLDFTKENFHNFSSQYTNACQFISKDEKYSSFDWLQKLKDDAKRSTFDDVSENSESDIELSNSKIESNGVNRLLPPDSASNAMTTSDIFPVSQDISDGLVTSSSLVMDELISKSIGIKRSSRKLPPRPAHLLSVHDKSSDCSKSSPNIMNGTTDESEALHPPLFTSVNDNRQFAYIENKMRQKENEYCNWEDHTLFVGTWNVNGRIDDSMNLSNWLTPAFNSKYPSFYVLGFQELDLSIGSVALNKGNMSYLEERWLKLIENSEPFKKNHYKRLYRSRLSGILMIIYVDKKLSKFVPEVQLMDFKVPTGMFNVMGNKGAVGIRFRVLNSNLCFINCHLAAGESNRLRRDQDFREIEKNLRFKLEFDKEISIYDHDLVFLMGDMNYRILNIDAATVRDRILRNDIEMLLENDELLTGSKSVFKRFTEATITFLPTYKFDPNTDEYDTSEKNRVPSFCDRIMWCGDRCSNLDYSSHMSLRTSDHKPVSALFSIGLKKIDHDKLLKVQETIIRDMDFIYNLSLPQATISGQEINFEAIHFYEYRQASITFTNTGHHEFMFNFKEIPGCPKIPDWLTVRPSEGTVQINETCDLVFEIFINANNVSKLNTKSEVQCILILTLLGGKDYFITVTADLVPTSFGLPLSLLVTLKDPIATLSRKDLYEQCIPFTKTVSVGSTQTRNAFSTPKEIFVMIDFLLNNIDEEELFARPGNHYEIQYIREQLDTNGIKADFSAVSVHSVAEALLMFVNAFYWPIVPSELLKECMAVHNSMAEAVKVIIKLPPDHRNLFHYLTTFLRKVLDHRSRNGTDIRSLGILFVDLIFRPNYLLSSDREICSQFIKQFIENDSAKYLNFIPSLQ